MAGGGEYDRHGGLSGSGGEGYGDSVRGADANRNNSYDSNGGRAPGDGARVFGNCYKDNGSDTPLAADFVPKYRQQDTERQAPQPSRIAPAPAPVPSWLGSSKLGSSSVKRTSASNGDTATTSVTAATDGGGGIAKSSGSGWRGAGAEADEGEEGVGVFDPHGPTVVAEEVEGATDWSSAGAVV